MEEKNSDSYDLDNLLDILGNNYRRQILRLLSARKLYPQQIAEILGITPSAVIKHLKVMEEADVIKKEEEKRTKGGRPLQYYYVEKNIAFSFEMFNPCFFRIDILDTEELRETNSILHQPVKNKLEQIHENFKEILQYQQELQEIEERRIEILRRREHLYEQLRDYIKGEFENAERVVSVFRAMLEFRGDKPFSRQELEKEQGLKAEESATILSAWKDLDLIEIDQNDWLNPKVRFILPKAEN